MSQVEKLLIFLAAPGDVPTERRYVGEIVADLNRTVASDNDVVLQVVSWENDAFPGYGQDAQALINVQIAEMSKYALFIGIMWNRLGTPTPRAASGTVEEFERAVEAFKHKRQPAIWFYFRESASRLNTEDQLEQRKKVLAFKKDVQANGMPWTYKNPADFRDKFRNHMILWLNARTRTPEPGTIFRDTLRDGSQGPDMVAVPPGTFLLANTTVAQTTRRVPGFSRSTLGDARTSQSITRLFAIGRYQVTFEEYDRFAAATGHEFPSHGDLGRGRDRVKLAKRPVVNVTWQDAVEYAKWLSAETGKRYRLPSEAEWEYAARSGGKEENWAGTSREEELGEYAWYKANSGFETHPVGGKKPNGLGLYDMSGNVWEWVQVEDVSGSYRVARGGSWSGEPEDLWVANRFRLIPDASNFHIGFRPARDID